MEIILILMLHVDCQVNEVKCNDLCYNFILFSVLLSQFFSFDPGSWAVTGMLFGYCEPQSLL